MLKPPHPVARLAYALAMWINPNNHALDGGRASSAMEKEAVAEIARMFGWDDAPRPPHQRRHDGEPRGAVDRRRARARRDRPRLVAGALHAQPHQRRAEAAVRERPGRRPRPHGHGRARRRASKAGGVGTVVATLGTTATGSVDPLAEILALRDRHGFRVHADCAYGGYYALADNLAPPARAAFDRIAEVDSIVIDPHKHGLQPYGCGCVLFRDPGVGSHYRHDSPYTYFSSKELHLGEISLECSRPGRGRGRAVGDADALAARARRRVRRTAPRLPGRGARVPRAAGDGRPFHPGLSARARHRRLGRAREVGRRVVRARARDFREGRKRPACISRSPSCPRRSSAIPGGRAAP